MIAVVIAVLCNSGHKWISQWWQFLQRRISGSGHGQMSVRVPLTQNCLNNVFLHIKSMVTVVVGLVTTLTGSKGRIDPAAARNAVHSWRMSTVSPRTTFRVTSDPRHNKVYLPVLCALHEWPLTQMSFYCRCYTSPVRCALLQVTSDPWHRCDVLTLPVLCDHLLMECKSILQGRCSGHPSDLEAVLPWVTQAPVLS